MVIESVSVAELSKMSAPYNPRKITDREMESLRKSIRFFGFVEPVIVNRRSGHIVGGHQRVKAAEAEGLPGLPVLYVDLDPPSEKQLNLALNRISGDWDREKLASLMADLDILGADMSLTGFTDQEIAKFLESDVPEYESESVIGGLEYRVVVTCNDEHDQAEMVTRLESEGRKCQLLMS